MTVGEFNKVNGSTKTRFVIWNGSELLSMFLVNHDDDIELFAGSLIKRTIYSDYIITSVFPGINGELVVNIKECAE